MRLTDHTDYSLRVLIYLNQTKKRSTLLELAINLKISRNNLIKVSNQLTKLGLVEASRGRAGGLLISEKTGDKNLGEIIRHTEETFHVAECFSNHKTKCTFIKKCILKASLQEALMAFIATLEKYTLNDVTPPKIS